MKKFLFLAVSAMMEKSNKLTNEKRDRESNDSRSLFLV